MFQNFTCELNILYGNKVYKYIKAHKTARYTVPNISNVSIWGFTGRKCVEANLVEQ